LFIKTPEKLSANANEWIIITHIRQNFNEADRQNPKKSVPVDFYYSGGTANLKVGGRYVRGSPTVIPPLRSGTAFGCRSQRCRFSATKRIFPRKIKTSATRQGL